MQLSEPQEAEVQVHPLLLHIPLQRVVSVAIVPYSWQEMSFLPIAHVLVERIPTHYCRTIRVKTDDSNFCEQSCCKKQPLQFQPTPNTSSKISEHYLVNNDSNYHAYAINWLSSTACDPKCSRRNTP